MTNPQRPVQLVIAGKAHPADEAGQALIRQWTQFIRRPEARRHVIFFSDYNMLLSEYLVQGVDVWINTPRRPWEASGTSGMKVLVNGGINLSELDGWWAEAYTPEVGWALGDGQEHGDDPAWDAAEAVTLYELLEREVIPEFYARNDQGIPTAWVARMRESMALLTPRFSANRAVREYTEQHYLPAARGYRKRAEKKGAAGQAAGRLAACGRAPVGRTALRRSEDRDQREAAHLRSPGLSQRPRIRSRCGSNCMPTVSTAAGAVRQQMERVRQLTGASGGYVYRAAVSAARPPTDYTARALPCFDGVAVPLENARILWQR